MLGRFRRARPQPAPDPLEESIAAATEQLARTATQPTPQILDLPRVERQVVAARWRQSADPRLGQLEQLIAEEERLHEVCRRLREEVQCLEFVRTGTVPIRLPTRLDEELYRRQQNNEAAISRLRRAIGDLIEQA